MGKKAGVWMKCGHCHNVWFYTGKQEFWAACSSCRWKVSLTNPENRATPAEEEIAKAKKEKEQVIAA